MSGLYLVLVSANVLLLLLPCLILRAMTNSLDSSVLLNQKHKRQAIEKDEFVYIWNSAASLVLGSRARDQLSSDNGTIKSDLVLTEPFSHNSHMFHIRNGTPTTVLNQFTIDYANPPKDGDHVYLSKYKNSSSYKLKPFEKSHYNVGNVISVEPPSNLVLAPEGNQVAVDTPVVLSDIKKVNNKAFTWRVLTSEEVCKEYARARRNSSLTGNSTTSDGRKIRLAIEVLANKKRNKISHETKSETKNDDSRVYIQNIDSGLVLTSNARGPVTAQRYNRDRSQLWLIEGKSIISDMDSFLLNIPHPIKIGSHVTTSRTADVKWTIDDNGVVGSDAGLVVDMMRPVICDGIATVVANTRDAHPRGSKWRVEKALP